MMRNEDFGVVCGVWVFWVGSVIDFLLVFVFLGWDDEEWLKVIIFWEYNFDFDIIFDIVSVFCFVSY